MDGPDDAALVAACKAGDASAWDALVRRHRRLIYSIPTALRLDADECDEVFQLTCLRLFEHLDQLRDPQKVAGWLAVTARRESWALRRSARRIRGFDEGEEASLPAEPSDLPRDLQLVLCEHAVQLALSRLGEPCHALLTALHVEDPTPSYAEIAQRLNRPIGSLGPTRARCLEKLKRLYQDAGGPPPPAER
jgi:RNA polymerase sigma factor (sigma-70 family)